MMLKMAELTSEDIKNGNKLQDPTPTERIFQRQNISDEENDTIDVTQEEVTSQTEYKMQIVWRNVLVYIIFHFMALYGFILGFTVAKWETVAFGKLLIN